MAEIAPEHRVKIIRVYNETFMRRDLAAMRRYVVPYFIQRHSNIRTDFTVEEQKAILGRVMACSCIVLPVFIS